MEFVEKLELRNKCIDELTDFVQGSADITALLVLGDDSTESLSVNVAIVVNDVENVRKTYGRVHYFISNEMDFESKKTLRREDNFALIEYTLESGITLTALVCTCSELFDAPWWRCVFDTTGEACEAMNEANRVEEDKLADEPSEEPEDEADEFEDDFEQEEAEEEPVFEIVPDPEEPPAPVEEEEPEQQEEEESEEDAYWRFVSENVRTAKHAIASGAYIRATEIINTLRKMLIELICVRNGITENFERSIDFVECEEKNLLVKTYPNGTDKTSLISALAVETELFDRLA